MRKFTTTLTVLLSILAFTTHAQKANIKDFGAIGDGLKMNTEFIQKAVDSMNSKGGGKVIVPEGIFLTGTIHLKTGVELVLQKNAVLLGSTNLADYERNDRWYALLIADDQKNISLTGEGTIDGQGRTLAMNVLKMVKNGSVIDPLVLKRPNERLRPQLIEIQRSDEVLIKGVTLLNAACWVQTYNHCTRLTIDSITVKSTAYWNNDGIDIQDCQHVVVKNSSIDAADDGICLKSSDPKSACEEVLVTDCKIRSSASAVKFGTASLGGFRNIKVKNIYAFDTYRTAIALEIVDGGTMEDIDVSHITAKNTGGAIFIRLGQRKKTSPPGIIRRIHISDVSVEVPNAKTDAGYTMEGPPEEDIYPHNLLPAQIVGLPGHPIEDVTMENIVVTYGGGADRSKAYVSLDSLSKIPEMADEYPEFSMFGELPAWALYVRHAAGITIKNSKFRFLADDFRSPLVFDDVKKVYINKLNLASGNRAPAVILHKVTQHYFKKLITAAGTNAEIRILN
ncbi:MAG: glycosyl hydrolase family 28 protein [Pedobacter sp.]|uniref:glycoside hydrolase family 28 protein n=1 Tax=Pedobacter sp. TaxID=1411316 RepID=UPI00339A1086